MPMGERLATAYKAIAEQALAANYDKLKVVVSPHLIFGPGDPHLLPRVIDSVKAGRLNIVGEVRTEWMSPTSMMRLRHI